LDREARHVIGLRKRRSESARLAPRCRVLLVNTKNETFTLREARAPADNPTNVTVVLELNDRGSGWRCPKTSLSGALMVTWWI